MQNNKNNKNIQIKSSCFIEKVTDQFVSKAWLRALAFHLVHLDANPRLSPESLGKLLQPYVSGSIICKVEIKHGTYLACLP